MKKVEGREDDNSNVSNDLTWPTWAIAKTPLGLEKRRALFLHFASWMSKHAQDVWVGRSELELPADIHEKTIGSLLSTANNSGERRILAHWWDILIAAGNQNRIWKISFPSREIILPRVPPVLVHRDFQVLLHFRMLQNNFINLICSGIEKEKLLDAAICSAVFFGGIASSDRVSALSKLTCADLDGDQSLLWAILKVPHGPNSTRNILWYPDSLTGTLLIRSKDSGIWTGLLGTGKNANYLLNALLSLGLPPLPTGWSINDFIRASQVALSLDHMGVISAYLSDHFISHSLPVTAFHRIAQWDFNIANNKPPDNELGSIVKGEEQSVPHHEFTSNVDSKSQREITNKMAAILKNGRNAYRNFEMLQEESGSAMWPITYFLIEWAKWRIRPGKGEKGIQPVSVLRYFRPLVRSLIIEAEAEDLFSLDVEDFETLYELSAASIKGEDERSRVWTTLRNFHDFLFLCGAPDVNFSELDGYISEHSQANVSANLITETEFSQFKKIFFREHNNGNFSASRRVFFAAMLGYRAGLRRREVQLLLHRDYHPGLEPFILIRPSRFAKLKSNASNRRIPLKALLPDDELQEFKSFMEKRNAVSNELHAFVFADSDVTKAPSQARLIDPVTEAFYSICGHGRNNFCFHHLRHSFANWIFLALLSSDQPELLKGRTHFIDSDLLKDGHIQTIRDSIFTRLPGTIAAPDSRHLYQVAALMGHLSPITTLHSYLHLLDWISMRSLDIALGNTLANLGTPDLGKVCGLSPSAPYQTPYRDFSGQPISFLRHFIRSRGRFTKSRLEYKLDVEKKLQKVVHAINAPTPPNFGLVIKLVGRRMKLNDSTGLAKTFEINAQAIDALYKDYMRLYAKQSVQNPKEKISQPSIPRTITERGEFWRIIDTTERAYNKKENRAHLSLAAECLIRRNGPRTGNLYFGKRLNDAPDIARGILLMGINPIDIKLMHRQVSLNDVADHALSNIIDEIRKLGIAVIQKSLHWDKRTKKSDRIRLEIAVNNLNLGAHERSEGRVRGLNYGAMWINFAHLCELHRPDDN